MSGEGAGLNFCLDSILFLGDFIKYFCNSQYFCFCVIENKAKNEDWRARVGVSEAFFNSESFPYCRV